MNTPAITNVPQVQHAPNPLNPRVENPHEDWVVVDDPTGEYRDGALVKAALASQLEARGVCLLPVIMRQMMGSAVGGFFRRAWGSGWPLSKDHPRMHCPMLVHVETAGRGSPVAVHWRARLMGNDGAPGSLRLGVDTSQGIAALGHLTDAAAADLRRLGKRDERGGWTVGGAATAQMGMRGFLPLGLYGVGPGLRVAWAAASVTLAR